MKKEAAKKAGFASSEIADRAVSVFERGGADLLAKLVAGEVTVSAAYASLAKPDKSRSEGDRNPRTKKADAGSDAANENAAQDRQDHEHDAEHVHKEDHPAEPPASAQPQEAEDQAQAAAGAGDKPASTSRSAADATQAKAAQPGQGQAEQEEEAAAADTAPKPTTQPERKQPEIRFKEALEVVLMAAKQEDPDLRRTFIDMLAAGIGITVWMPSDDPLSDLSELDDHVTERLEALAETDPDAVSEWVENLNERLGAVLRAAAWEQDDE